MRYWGAPSTTPAAAIGSDSNKTDLEPIDHEETPSAEYNLARVESVTLSDIVEVDYRDTTKAQLDCVERA